MAAVATGTSGTNMADAAARNSISEKQMSSAIQTAMTSGQTVSTDPLLTELKQQTNLLSAIAGNTKEMGSVSANMVTALNSVQQNTTEVLKVAANNGSAEKPTQVNLRNTDIFGNFKGDSSSVLKPSMDALRIAAGGNLPNLSPLSV